MTMIQPQTNSSHEIITFIREDILSYDENSDKRCETCAMLVATLYANLATLYVDKRTGDCAQDLCDMIFNFLRTNDYETLMCDLEANA